MDVTNRERDPLPEERLGWWSGLWTVVGLMTVQIGIWMMAHSARIRVKKLFGRMYLVPTPPGWSRVDTPFYVLPLDPELRRDAPELWAGIQFPENRVIEVHRQQYDQMAATLVSSEEGVFYRFAVRDRQTQTWLELVWTADGMLDHVEARAPDPDYTERVDGAAVLREYIGSPDAIAMRLKLLSLYGTQVGMAIEFSDAELDAFEHDGHGCCGIPSQSCPGRTCSFLRSIGVDPMTGVQNRDAVRVWGPPNGEA